MEKEKFMTFFEELQARGLIKDMIDEENLKEHLQHPCTVYIGFDPTADCLHVGHLQQICILKRWQEAGHNVIALAGGATGMIGDPKPTQERRLLSADEIKHNVEAIKVQLGNFLDFNSGTANLVDNYDWLGQMSLIDFLRDYGKYFNVNYMINKDTIAKRLETGISFTEFTYTILQAIDFLQLYKNYGCTIQLGGSDQWGNLVSGTDLIRKVCGPETKVYGITSPLLTKSDGGKFGKTETGTVWLSPGRTSAYEFYQFWVNTSDADIINYMKRLSFMSLDDIYAFEEKVKTCPEKREAQKAFAAEMTKLVHGEAALEDALKITETFFKGNINDLTPSQLKSGLANAKKFKVNDGDLLIDCLVNGQICSSKREARDLISQGSIQVNGQKQNSLEYKLSKEAAYDNEFSIIKKGKKNYFVCEF